MALKKRFRLTGKFDLMNNKYQYEKTIKTMCHKAYRCIDNNYVNALDALHIPHLFGNPIADLPPHAHLDVLKHIIKCSIRDLKEYGLAGVYLIGSRAKTLVDENDDHDFFIVTKHKLPTSLTDDNQLLNKWLGEGKTLTTRVNVTFTDQQDYCARKDSCCNGRCEIEHNTGVKCKQNKCLCFPCVAQHQGFPLLFIDVNY